MSQEIVKAIKELNKTVKETCASKKKEPDWKIVCEWALIGALIIWMLYKVFLSTSSI